MILHRQGREYYTLTIDTEPAVTGWEASFDGGTTWAPGALNGDVWQWLVAGPLAPTDQPCMVIDRSTAPLIRAVDTPEILIRSTPTIYLI